MIIEPALQDCYEDCKTDSGRTFKIVPATEYMCVINKNKGSPIQLLPLATVKIVYSALHRHLPRKRGTLQAFKNKTGLFLKVCDFKIKP